MKFCNAYDGVKKIYTAEIMSLVAAALSLVSAVLSGVTDKDPESGAVVIAAFVVIGAAVLMIVAEIMNIRGVSIASKDEPAFKTALIALIVGIGANILVTSFSDNAVLSEIGNAACKVTQIVASFFICTGIINLADRLSSAEVSEKGKKVRSLLLWFWLISTVLDIVSALLNGNESLQVITVIVSVISAVITIAGYIFYIGLLGKAKTMLQ